MTGRPGPFRAEDYAIGLTRGGTSAILARVTPAGARTLATALPQFGPWAAGHYASEPAALERLLLAGGDGAVRYEIRAGSALAGALVIRWPWLAGPYVQLLAVLPAFQGEGLGALVLDWLARETEGHAPNLWLCVSTFNTRAAAFYRRHGFREVATLDALVMTHIDELLMRKRL